ncbi:sensor histidine kinase [Limosilactobacillus sp. STM2_1]|uniref:histidine kinase n=1 Tax=Limosilactobacillus rudii TaxID=2759755 RepID=A0A7W3UJZ4_9LACO|nr:sensor histidine kinase [Limosilactobacillus rudii]MBB1079158.1 sensor histidine kinase [Limosilactobacillus rudii]MBB1096967.1 sensor histidine kinase [Limosilactobacillus rudii]MCD7133935.1 sensor histidine kinase [Limosilactobacillus rudii]
MIYLTILMAERVGLIIILAFLLVSVPFFRRLLFNHTIHAKIQLILLFSVFAIMANMTGIEIDANNQLHDKIILTAISANDSIINARILVVSVAGIIGGPWVGSLVGIVTGVHRIIQAGIAFQSWFYIPSSVLIGFLSGFLYHDRKSYFKVMTPWHGFIVGLLMESIQMAFILFFSPTGWALVHYIALPMIFVNSVGTSIFLSIISMYLHQEEELRAMQTHSVLQLTNETLPYFRQGLSRTSAQNIVKIIKKYTNFDAVSITDRKHILAHIGAGSDHHIPGNSLETTLSMKVIKTGQIEVADHSKLIGCKEPKCPLEAAIVAPLRINNTVIGTLKMYYVDCWHLTPVEIQLATGLCEIFANQIALGQAEVQAQLIRDAEIKSLQAQVNPHFFFNAINTITAILRHDRQKARKLLLQLSTYFRANLIGARATEISLQQELNQVDAYLELEQTRFPNKYQIIIKQNVNSDVYLPPFTIQVLVENAIKHAFGSRKQDNTIEILIKKETDRLQIQVTDNGTGISHNLINKIGTEPVVSQKGNGNALYNLNQRLIGLYDQESALHISSDSAGTIVKISLPYHTKEFKKNESFACR